MDNSAIGTLLRDKERKRIRYEVSKEYGIYMVQEGDTIESISEGVHVDVLTLTLLNNLDNQHRVKPRQIIYLR